MDGSTALMWAASRGDDSIMKLLLDDEYESIDPNLKNEELHLELQMGTGEIIDAYSAVGIVPPRRRPLVILYKRSSFRVLPGYNALDAAVRGNHVCTVELLLKDPRIDMYGCDKDGRTPFMRAATNGNLDIINLFLNSNYTDINRADIWYRSAIQFAVGHGQWDVLEALLRCPGFYTHRVLEQAALGGHQGFLARLIYSPGITSRAEIQRAVDAVENFTELCHVKVCEYLVGLRGEWLVDDVPANAQGFFSAIQLCSMLNWTQIHILRHLAT